MQRVGQLTQLVRELSRQGREHPWAEFKHNNTNPDTIGKLVSAISNIAAVLGRPTGIVVWGIEDNTGRIVGTNFEPHAERTGNQHLVAWLDQTTTAAVRTEFTDDLLGRAAPRRARDRRSERVTHPVQRRRVRPPRHRNQAAV